MNHLEILLPFGLPQVDMARELLRQCRAPALATLLARGQAGDANRSFDAFSRGLPHEHWLSGQFGLPTASQDGNDSDERGNSPPVAAALLRKHDPQLQQGHWFVVQPAHIHVARDHLVLTDIDHLALTEAESRRFFASAQSLFEEIGRSLIYLDASTWLMRADDWAGLRTSSPHAASGRNIDIWMPSGPGELAWRKLQNEVQMQWFADALNEQRESHGKKAVNSLWLWGGADAAALAASAANPHQNPYQSCFNLRGCPQALNGEMLSACGPGDVLSVAGERGLLQLDTLLEPGLTSEWGLWLQGMETLDREWFAPLTHALRCKRLQRLTLVLSGQDRLLQRSMTAASLRKFWVRPSLSLLAG